MKNAILVMCSMLSFSILKCDSSGNCSGGAQLEITDTGSFYHGTKKSIYSIRLSLLEKNK